jgi:hypothetical protein
MSNPLDVESIYREEYQRWLKEDAPRRSLRDVISSSVPYWIIVVAAVLYGLSAPHTAAVFDKLTPGWGWIAPVGVEFGLLYAAFRRRYALHSNEAIPWTLWTLEVLLFLTAMLVNGAGAFTSVVSSAELNSLSFAAIVTQFGDFPATTQAALIMALLAAFIIPIGALVAGEGLAALTLERRNVQNFRDHQWHEVEFTLTYRAVFVRYLQQGLPDKEAKQRAFSQVKGYLGKSSPSAVRLLSAGNVQTGQAPDGQSTTLKDKVRTFLADNPDVAELSVRDVVIALRLSRCGQQG